MLPKVFQSKVCKSHKPVPAAVDSRTLNMIERDLFDLLTKHKKLEARVDAQEEEASGLKCDVEEIMEEQDHIRDEINEPLLTVEKVVGRVEKLEKGPYHDLKGLIFRLHNVEQALEDAQTNELSTEDAMAELNAAIDARASETSDLLAKIRCQQQQISRYELGFVSFEGRIRDVLQRLQFLEQKTEVEERGQFKVFRKS